ncbi:MAG: S-layer homology domain-containing protein [Promicromonosporaceae bacterium]|nr:S-layer homology domain-containing protein [Promicromonosporaceae bacterium]
MLLVLAVLGTLFNNKSARYHLEEDNKGAAWGARANSIWGAVSLIGIAFSAVGIVGVLDTEQYAGLASESPPVREPASPVEEFEYLDQSPDFVPHPFVEFQDVLANSQFRAYIAWMAQTGIDSGFNMATHREFRPGGCVQRQTVAVFLYRIAGEPTDFTLPRVESFPDVPVGHNSFRQIEWLVSTGIARGFYDGRFHPGVCLERQAAAAFLYRFAGRREDFVTPARESFLDVSVRHDFFREIEWLANTGVVEGWDMGTHQEFRPTEPIERQAMAAFLYRAFNGGHLQGNFS